MKELSQDGNYEEIKAELQAIRKKLEELEAREAAFRGSVYPVARRRFPKGLVVGSISLAAMLIGSGLLWGDDIKALFIDKAGNVGIGTQNPKYPLQVGDNLMNSDGKISIGKKDASGNRSMVLGYSSGYDFGFLDSGSKMQLGVNWEAPANSLYINKDGTVGIGKAVTTGGDASVGGDMNLANSALYFTKTDHDYSGIGNKVGHAAIENSKSYNSLMILGRVISAPETPDVYKTRVVSMWDQIGIGTGTPNATLDVRGDIRFAADGAMYATGSLDENLRIVRGTVKAGCTSQDGKGFSVSRNGKNQGECLVTFNKPFTGVPSASVTQIWENGGWGGDTRDNAVIAKIEAGSMRVIVGDAGGSKQDRGFSFVVIGPR